MNIIKLSGKVIFMNFSEKIALVKEHKELKGEYKEDAEAPRFQLLIDEMVKTISS